MAASPVVAVVVVVGRKAANHQSLPLRSLPLRSLQRQHQATPLARKAQNRASLTSSQSARARPPLARFPSRPHWRVLGLAVGCAAKATTQPLVLSVYWSAALAAPADVRASPRQPPSGPLITWHPRAHSASAASAARLDQPATKSSQLSSCSISSCA